MDKIKVEFTIDAFNLGNIVLIVEQMGATDFTFVTIKGQAKAKKPKKAKMTKTGKPRKQRAKQSSKGTDLLMGLLRRKGSAHRTEIATALENGGMSPTTMNGLLWKMQRDGMITREGKGTYQLARGYLNADDVEIGPKFAVS